MNTLERAAKHGAWWPWIVGGIVACGAMACLIIGTDDPKYATSSDLPKMLLSVVFGGAAAGAFAKMVLWFGASMERWGCKACGSRVKRGSVYCRRCGTTLPQG